MNKKLKKIHNCLKKFKRLKIKKNKLKNDKN